MDSPKSYKGTMYLCRHTYYTELNEKRRRERQIKKAAERAKATTTADPAARIAPTYTAFAQADLTSESTAAKLTRTDAEPAPADTAAQTDPGRRAMAPWHAGVRARLRDSKRIDAAICRAIAWLEIDDKSCRVERKAKRLPVGVMAAMLCLALSLVMIVAGAVISSKANMELYEAENRLASLRATESELSLRLELKNDLRYIEEQARGRLGMIDREHASVIAVDDKQEDKVEIYRSNRGGTAISALLDALGFFGE